MSSRGYVLVTYLAVLLVALLACISVTPRLIWNASASVPVGLYGLHPDTQAEVGDLVAVRPPEPLGRFLAERHYLPRGVPLMKRIAALPGQEVCRRDRSITVDGVPFGDALDRDRRGRPLPVWQGCRRLGDGELFLMNATVPDSLDGRYFGPLPAATVIGAATPLYTDEAGDGRFVWRAATR
ncbi:S26 family signal peptidase [Sphingomonas morindae]|uniref:S26 family signal peptidase n=1 Tax=Sphingomonas morindae TaxID=1541170 RepID=A0ABY4X3U5_9SPHN|nr:S26 family signal peptidase [Sphingomonas morindae]USI71536.1 S26 family signal peptidase [Sphingomonas morindae]